MREAFGRLIARKRPQRQVVSCALTPHVSKGHVDFETAYAQSAPAMIMLICHGFAFGTGVPVVYTKTATGWSFEGSRPFCHTQECSNGTDALDIVSVTGTIDATPWVPTMAFTYEVLGYCGAQLVCIETGSFSGKKITTAPDIQNANYQGRSGWTLTCCPVPVWKGEVD
ncbi:MAG: hypothetical protein WD044_11720 [Dongiaceae bacterium]